MTFVSLQLSLCAVTIIHMTSSQPTYDVVQGQNDVTTCRQTQEVMMTALSKLQKDLAELKVSVQPRHLTRCPSSFTYIESVNGCYKVVTDKMEWSVAGLQCRSLHKDAHLLVINDAAEQSAVAGMLASINETTQNSCFAYSPHREYFWAAGQRIDPSRGSTFIWRVASTNHCDQTEFVMTYTNWISGQPDYAHNREACMHLWSGHSYTWNDNDCWEKFCSICEIDMSVSIN